MGTTGQSITLANSIIGVGILAMPFCFQQCGVVLATMVLILMGLVSRLCCYFLLKSALLARRRTFEFLAFHVFGPAGKFAVEVGIIGFLMGSCIAYFVVVGDLGPQIIAKMFNINQSDMLRTSIMVIVSVVCVLPLGLLRNVDSLSNVSAATICFYFCLVLKVILEAASQLFSGDSAWTARVALWRPAGLLQCVPIMSMALFCQTQLFEIFESMPTLSLEKMTVVSKNAINICTTVYFTLGLFGYIAFNDHEISGNILMSLSPTMASDVIKLGFVMSVAFSFPLIIFPCRASLYSFLYKKVHSSHHDHIIKHSIPETSFRCITVAIIGVSLIISLLIPNIELVLGLVGSTIGVLICVVFPAACFVNVTFKNTNERVLAKGIVVLGLAIMVLGTFANLQAAESRHGRYEDARLTQQRIDQIVEEFFQKREREGGESGDAIKPIPREEVKNGVGDKKDSEVQPPNPVPPASSNEKVPNIDPDDVKKKSKDQMKIKDKKNEYDKVSESHPRNLKKHNGLNGSQVDNEIKAEIEKPNEVLKPAPEEKESKPKEQDKTDVKKEIIKQQKLIDTIKQHGEEQKELLKEQKELLDEIIKTKNEMEQNKKEVNSNEAKIIAVESIQKIADMAIKSLSGVTDKPKVAQEEPLEKIANKAVQEIAKKAVETIEAIKEIKEAPLETAPKKENENVGQSNLANPVQNVQPNQNVETNNVQNKPPPLNMNVQPINALPVAYQQQVNMQQNSVNLPQSANVPPPSNINMQPDVNIQQQQQTFNNQQQQQAPNIQQQQQNMHQQYQNGQQQGANVPQQEANIQNKQPVNIQYQQNIQQQHSSNLQQAANIQYQQSSSNQEQQQINILPVADNQKSANSQIGQQPPIMQQGNQQKILQGNVQHNANQQQLQQNIQVPNNNQQLQQNANIQQQQLQQNLQAPKNNQQSQQNVHNLAPQQNIQQSPDIQKQNADQQVASQNLQQAVVNQGQQQQSANQQQPIAQNLQQANIQLQNQNNDAQKRASREVKNDPPVMNTIQNIPNQNEIVQNEKQKAHSHSPDEPQSYKEGEDFESGRKNSAQNVPLPIAMNSNANGKSQVKESNVKESEIRAAKGENKNVNMQDTNKIHNIQNGVAPDLDNNVQSNANVAPIRHKREVVDCTEIKSLKPEDREICKKLVNDPKIIDDTQKIILKSNVDLGHVELPNNIPMHETMIHHVRSLKSIPENKRR